MAFELAICKYIYFCNYVYNHIRELRRQQVQGINESRKYRFRHLGQRKARQKMGRGVTVQVTKLSR